MLTIRNDVTKIKMINTELVKSALKEFGTATKAQIAEATNISVATCGKILNELHATGEVQEVAVTTGGYGRPAKSYAYNGNFSLVACLYVLRDMGKKYLSVRVTNLVGEILEEYHANQEKITYELIENAVAELEARYEKLSVVAIGLPAYITNGVIGLCSFEGLMGLPLKEMLCKRFPRLKFVVENDMNSSAFGYYRTECRGRDTTLAFLYSPMDLVTEKVIVNGRETEHQRVISRAAEYGAGFVSGGHVLRGFSGFGGEIAFLPIVRAKGEEIPDMTIDIVMDIIGAIIPVLNPEIIVLTGGYFTKTIEEEIRKRCSGLFAEQHIPQIVLRADIHPEYMNGLTQMALDEISCGIRLIEDKA